MLPVILLIQAVPRTISLARNAIVGLAAILEAKAAEKVDRQRGGTGENRVLDIIITDEELERMPPEEAESIRRAMERARFLGHPPIAIRRVALTETEIDALTPTQLRALGRGLRVREVLRER